MLAVLALLAVTTGVLAVPAWRHLRERPAEITPAVRLALLPGDDLSLGAGPDYSFGLAIAPDGRRLVFPASRAGLPQLWLRDISTGETAAIPGTESAVLPFWSPDGRAIGFFAGGRLRMVALESNEISDLAEAPSPRGAAWHTRGDIVFAPKANDGLYRRRASDGGLEPFTLLDSAAGETAHRFPGFAADGHFVLYFASASSALRQGIWIAPYDAPANRTRLTGGEANGIISGDVLFFASDEALLAQRLANLDAAGVAPTLIDRPAVIGTPVGRSSLNQLFAAAGAELLIFGPPRSGLRELRWANRQGGAAGSIGGAVDAWDLRIAPEGESVAVSQVDAQLGTLDVWAYDDDRPVPRRISPAIDADESVIWARDGTRLAWVTGRRSVAIRGALAQLPEEIVQKFDGPVRVCDWTPDGRFIVVSRTATDTRDDLWLVPTSGEAPTPYARGPFNETQAVVSTDGRWMAYASDESGQFDIYIDSFPKPGRRGRITMGGGSDPRWPGLGAELFFRRGSEVHVATLLLTGDIPSAVSSSRLFDAGADLRAYDVSADGQRFLLNVPAPEAAPRPWTAVVNWRALLGR